jgi:hypothetical protein
VFVTVVGAADTADDSPRWISVPEIVLGLVFLGLAAHIWRTRRRRRARESPPRWLAALDRLTPTRSAGLGLVLAGANPKNLGSRSLPRSR